MEISNRLKNQHLLWRAGFGPMAENAASLDSQTQKSLWEQLKKTSAAEPVKIEVAKNSFGEMNDEMKTLDDVQKTLKDPEQRKKLRQLSREGLKELNITWLEEMISSKAQLREKVSLFWHGHFACRVVNIFFQQNLLHSIRTHALGNFGDLLKAVSKSPAMLQFLNNQQNKKSSPNENFAREVMELFTMGRGNYTEQDVKEAARAFTGWGFNLQGEFVFRPFQHDKGSKTILGRTGNFTGDDVLNILLEQQQTAIHITRKLYRYLVNENADEEKVTWLAKRFFNNQYNTGKLLEDIFSSDWFYSEKNIGTRIKSPVELLAGIRRFLPLQLDNDQTQLLLQKVLGQVLFFPPNVAGWPGGRSWIDSSTLMVRLQIPQALVAKETLNIRAKSDDDVNMGQMIEEQVRIKKNRAIVDKGGSASIDWTPVVKIFEKTTRENLPATITSILLQSSSNTGTTVIEKYTSSESREEFIKSWIIRLMSTPEYQMC